MNVVFLDRDGTVIVDPPDERVDRLEKIRLFPDTLEALKELAKLSYGVVFVTNQAGIAEGRITEQEFWELHGEILKIIAPSKLRVLKTYICPHKPEDNCDCRKPKSTLLLQAAKELDIDLSHSWFIGDRLTDIAAGIDAGVRTVLVETANTPQGAAEAEYTAPDLAAAVKYIAQDGSHAR